MKLKKELFNKRFSHIYVEKEAFNYQTTLEILEKFKNSIKVEIDDYMEIFAKNNQNFQLQKANQNLILAVKKERYLYKGASVCENFGNLNFYYISSVLNCVYNCEYCYLQGVYSSGNIVIFVNDEQMFDEVREELIKRAMYICISYDTDLLALEGITQFVRKWYDFAFKYENLKVELRTKSINIKLFEKLLPNPNFIIAWTLSPEEFIVEYEKGTPNLMSRIKGINTLIQNGWNVRVCFDPVINISNFEEIYGNFVKFTLENIEVKRIFDISVGTFRISKDYLKRMRKNNQNSKILSYPFECKNGVYSYSEEKGKRMLYFLEKLILNYVDSNKLFIQSF